MCELTYHSAKEKLPRKMSSLWNLIWKTAQAPSAVSPGESESGGVGLLSAFTTPLASRSSNPFDPPTRAASSASEESNQNQRTELPPQEEMESPVQLRRDVIGEMVPIPPGRQNKEQNANDDQERERDEQIEEPVSKDSPISSGHEMLSERGAQ